MREDAGVQERGGVFQADARKLGAEFVGTFALVFAGCGAIAADAFSGGAVTHVGICLTFGLVVCVMIYATGHISGAHFNPAVTLGFTVAGRFPPREAPAYIASQLLAAVVAIAALKAAVDPSTLGGTTPHVSPAQAVVLESVLTFMLMFVISAVATDHRAVGSLSGVAIGGTVTLCALFGGPFTGASMNPARSLGPAVFSGDLGSMWIYTLGPVTGAVIGALTYRWLRCDGAPAEDAAGCC